LVFATFGALFGFWFVHGTGAPMGDPNNRITPPDPSPHEYVFGTEATQKSVSIWNKTNIEFPPSRPMFPFLLPPNNSFAAKSEPTINSTALPVTSTEKKDKWD
jgi:hypothetical protein